MFATMNRHETFRVDAGALRAARRTIYGLLGVALALEAVSLLFRVLGAFANPNSGPAHTVSHELAHLSGAFAVGGLSVGFLYGAYVMSSVIRGSAWVYAGGRKLIGLLRFVLEVGVVLAAGVLSLVMCSDSGHVFIGFIALAASLLYGTYRTVEFFETSLPALGRGRSDLHRVVADANNPRETPAACLSATPAEVLTPPERPDSESAAPTTPTSESASATAASAVSPSRLVPDTFPAEWVTERSSP
jgi:hypothetical protein